MDKPLISVIVPIYKVEVYLRRCVESIICQTYKNLEIVLVDDGSPDLCPAICDKYAIRDNRVKVIHKKNGGLSDARNAALDVIHGRYVTFVDSDDYVAADYVETLYHLLIENSADISCIQFIKFHEGSVPMSHIRNDDCQVLNSHDAIQKLLYFNGMETSAHCKLYRVELFEGIRYPFGKLFEDLGTTYKLFLKANKIVNSKAEKYFYLQRENSIEQSQFTSSKMDILAACEELRDGVLPRYPDLSRAWNCRYFCANFHILLAIPKGRFEGQTAILKRNILKYRQGVLLDCHARRKARIAALLSYFGFNLIRRVWHLKNKVKTKNNMYNQAG